MQGIERQKQQEQQERRRQMAEQQQAMDQEAQIAAASAEEAAAATEQAVRQTIAEMEARKAAQAAAQKQPAQQPSSPAQPSAPAAARPAAPAQPRPVQPRDDRRPVQPRPAQPVRLGVDGKPITGSARAPLGGGPFIPKPMPAGAQPQARPQQGGYQSRPQGQGGYQSRPQGQGGFQNRPQGQGGYQSRPQGQGGYQNRPQGQGGFQNRGGQGGGFNRGGQSGGFNRPAGGNRRGGGLELTPTVEKERVSNYDPNKNAYQRQYDPENRNRSRKNMIRSNSSVDDERRSYRKARKKPMSVQQTMAPIKIEHAVITTEQVLIKDLAEKIGKPAADIIKKLFMLGIMATINQEIDFDTAALVAADYDITLEQKLEKTYEEVMAEESQEDQPEDLVPRAPVVTIMGHVDHGKTSLLDKIRSTRVTEGEAGGITQHIGAYRVEINGNPITFLDTPGHEAFTAMRARGAQATDIAILVVAADDGVMPQTIEAINHAKAAEVPIIVAVNKMDKPAADPERIKQQMTEYELVPEEWGGDTIFVPVSAMTGEGIDTLLENIILVSEVQELKANPNRLAKGIIVEAELDKGRGPVATVLVQNGTLHVGDTVVAGTAFGRVRAMINDKGERVEAAYPSEPVEVLGFSEVPDAGDILNAVEDDKLSRQVAEERRDKIKAEQMKAKAKVTLDDLFSQIAEGEVKELLLIVKADVQGSVEAVKQALEKLSNSEVRVRAIHGGVGAINETDVMLAAASNAIIIGFNVRPDVKAREAVDREKVDMRLYRVIYHATEDIEKAMKGMLEPEFKDVDLGAAEVRSVFKVTGVGTVAGCYVTEGKVQRNAKARLVRNGIVVYEGKVDSLKRFKDDAREVAQGYECGMTLENYNDIKEGDVIEVFITEEVARD